MAWGDSVRKTMDDMQKEINTLKEENAELKKFKAEQALFNDQMMNNDVALKQMVDKLNGNKDKVSYFG